MIARVLAVAALALSFAGCGAPGDRLGIRVVGPDSVLVPPFVDHHVHVFNVGWWLLQSERSTASYVNAAGAGSESEVVARVVAAATGREWVTGFGWSQESWGTSVLPSNVELSSAVRSSPVALARTDGHALWVNRAALSAAGLSQEAPGVLLERDVEPVVALIPTPSDEDIKKAWRLGAEALAERGVLRAYDAGVLALPGVAALNTDFGRYVRLLAEEDRARALPITLNLMIPAPSAFADSVLAMPTAQRSLSPNVRITHLKLFSDGALGSRGAALSHEYADDSRTHGVLRMTADEIEGMARRAIDAGLDVATHAIGDRAVHEVLDAYESLLIERPSLVPARLRIEHFSYASEADLARVVRLGVALSVQSNFNTPKGVSPTFAEQRIGSAGASRVYAWDRLDRAGALLVEGSDYFGEPGTPLLGLQSGLIGINAIGERGDTPEARRRLIGLTHAWLAPGGVLESNWGGRAEELVLTADPRVVPIDSMSSVRVKAIRRTP